MGVSGWLVLLAALVVWPAAFFYFSGAAREQPLGEIFLSAAIFAGFGFAVGLISGSAANALIGAGVGSGLVLGIIGLPLFLAKVPVWISEWREWRRVRVDFDGLDPP